MNTMDTGSFSKTSDFSLSESIKNHPTAWSLYTILWVLSCILVWKLELLALERSQQSGYTLYNTPTHDKPQKPNNQQLPWYLPEIGSKWTPECKDLLENYARVPLSQQEAHIKRVRDSAFQTSPLATVGEFWFLVLGLAEHPRYPQILQRLAMASNKSDRMLIDLGTCLGQDLRKLVHDGASVSQLFGIDKYGPFEEIGYQFFRDRNDFTNTFVQADVFSNEENSLLVQTMGSWDIVVSSMFLHAFDWHAQLIIAEKMIRLAKGRGSLVAGLLAGDAKEQDVPVLPPLVPEGMKVTRFVHSKGSLVRLFKEVEERLGMPLRVEVTRQEAKNSVYTREIQTGYFATEDAQLLFYFVEIL